MLKKTFTVVDYDGIERTRDRYFDISEAECIDMEMGIDGGYAEMLERIVKEQNGVEIYKRFKEIVLLAYGEKSADGTRFIKSDELSIAFTQTKEFSVLMRELTTDAKAAADFMEGIFPEIKGKKPELTLVNTANTQATSVTE